MRRRRHLVVVVVAALSTVLAACTGLPGVFQPLPVSGSGSGLLQSRPYLVTVYASFPTAAAGLKIELDSTAGVNPEHVRYQVNYAGGSSEVDGRMTGPDGFHFEHVMTYPFQPGDQVVVILSTECGYGDACTAWNASLQTFNYRLSAVP